VLQEAAQLQAQVQAGAARVHELEAQLEDKVQWQARMQKRLDKFDELLKRYQNAKLMRTMYSDTLSNMGVFLEVCFTSCCHTALQGAPAWLFRSQQPVHEHFCF
jgi:hypothetical protein